jgi:hypothetical protein
METLSDIINKTINDNSTEHNQTDMSDTNNSTIDNKIDKFNKEMEESEKELDDLFNLMAKRRQLLSQSNK